MCLCGHLGSICHLNIFVLQFHSGEKWAVLANGNWVFPPVLTDQMPFSRNGPFVIVTLLFNESNRNSVPAAHKFDGKTVFVSTFVA